MREVGFSLVELIVVMAIIGALLAITALDFRTWSVKSAMERQARELQSDLNNARLTAVQKKRFQRVTLKATSYSFATYSSVAEYDADGAGTVTSTRNLSYPLGISDYEIDIDTSGLLLNDTGDHLKKNEPINVVIQGGSKAVHDCVQITAARIGLGKYDGTNCVVK
jgi:prepilin-type N-terminal cleavage/methylation domain-containing protein